MKNANTKVVEDAVGRVFKRREEEIDKKLNEMFFLLPSGDPSYQTVLLMRAVKESLKAKGLSLT
jgi:hypothetical protein